MERERTVLTCATVTADFSATSRAEIATITVLALAGSALGSLALGRDFNTDLLHYHFYNGFAFLAGRLDRDIAPAGVVSYFNPLLDAAHYLGMTYLRPRVFGALLGAFQGLNVLFVWAIARRTLGRDGPWLAPLAAVLAGLGQNAVSLLGTTFADTTVSVPALGALFLLVGERRISVARVFAASFVAGAAVGLKPTVGAALAGLATLVLLRAWRERRASFVLAFAAGTLSGWAITDGWWALSLWRRFDNPFYPLFNNLFHSPFGLPAFRLDPRWGVRHPLDWLRPPIDAALGFHRRLQEVPFRDARLLLPLACLLPWLGTCLARARSGQPLRDPRQGLLPFWLVTYAAWLAAFHYYRYGAVLELLAPVVAFALLREAWPRRASVAAGVVALGLLMTTSVNQWGRQPWRDRWFEPRIPALGQQGDQLVFLRDVVLSFTIPFFPADARFVGLATARGPATDLAISRLVRGHKGPLLMLVRPPSDDDAEVRVFGLHRAGPCARTRFGSGMRLLLCPLARSGPGGSEEGEGPTVSGPARSWRAGG
jgi:hypothetical protein